MKPFIHLFKVVDKSFIYDVNTNQILNITKESYDGLQGSKIYENTEIKGLKALGYLSSNHSKKIEHPESGYLKELLNEKIASVTLQVTQNCNLFCSYCPYSGTYYNRSHQNRKMSLERAIQAVDFLFSHSKQRKIVNVGFYGGEPLIEFELIRSVVDWINSNYSHRKVTYSITTNGTLLNEQIIKFLKDNNFTTMISLDGPASEHNKNRLTVNGCGSYDCVYEKIQLINLKYSEYAQNLILNSVISNNTDFKCVNDFFIHNENVKSIRQSTSIVSDQYEKDAVIFSEKFHEEYQYEFFKGFMANAGLLNKKYVNNIPQKYFKRLSEDNSKNEGLYTLQNSIHHGGPCVPGVHKLFVDVDGNLYPCEKVSESSNIMKIGHLDEGFDYKRAEYLLNVGKISEERCLNCWAIRRCSICAAHCDDQNQLSDKIKHERCKVVMASVENELKDYCVQKIIGELV